jgi:hypothetical protein
MSIKNSKDTIGNRTRDLIYIDFQSNQLYLHDISSKVLWRVSTLPPDHTASHPGRCLHSNRRYFGPHTVDCWRQLHTSPGRITYLSFTANPTSFSSPFIWRNIQGNVTDWFASHFYIRLCYKAEIAVCTIQENGTVEIQTWCRRLLGVGRGRKYHLKYKMTMNSSLYFIPSDVNKISVFCVQVLSLWWNFCGLQLDSNLLHHFCARIFYSHATLYAQRYTNFGEFHLHPTATWKFNEQA